MKDLDYSSHFFNNTPVKRHIALRRLRTFESDLRRLGAASVYLFGSTARNDAGPQSDVDIFIDYKPRSRFSLIELSAIQRFLTERLSVPVDVTTRDSLRPSLREGIINSAIRVF